MREGAKTLVAALAVFLLAAGLAACGSGSSSTGSSETAAQGGNGNGTATSAKEGTKPAKPSGEGGSAEPGVGPPASAFHPKPHHDSGGGSAQFIVKGGDNSVQEFGAEASEGELQKAASALHGFLDARAEGNWAAACRYLAKSISESFAKFAAGGAQGEGASCAAVLAKLSNPAAKSAMKQEAEKADVGSLRTEGDRSFIIYRGLGKAIMAMPMAQEGGEWKVAGLTGTPLN